MAMPKYFDLVRLSAQIGALIGCLVGIFTILSGLPAFGIGFFFGMTTIASGVLIGLGSLAGLGIIDCFLAMVQAQIETRNAIVAHIALK